jgi:hypothetical protein
MKGDDYRVRMAPSKRALRHAQEAGMFARAANCLCIFVLGAAICRADDKWATALFSERGVDFGTVPRGAVLRHNFVIQNRTNELLNILDVRASCGCTTGRALVSSLQPGQTSTIEAQMDTRNFVGVKATTLTITVLTAGGRQAEVRLSVKSNILSDIVLNPGTLQFGVISKGQQSEQAITIDRHGAPQWRVERMLASKQLSRSIDAVLTEAYRNEHGVGYVLKVTTRPDAPAGTVHEEIRLATNDRETPIVPILVHLEVRGSLTVTPQLLSLGQASTASGTVQGRVLVRGKIPFKISSVEGTGDGFEVNLASNQEAKALQVLTVSFHPEQTTMRGDLRRTLRIATDMPSEGSLEVQVVVHAVP